MKQIYKKYMTNMALIWAGCFILFLFVFIIVSLPQNRTKKRIQTRLNRVEKQYHNAQNAAQVQNQERLKRKIENLDNNVGDFVINFGDSANLTFDISQIADALKVTELSIKSKGNHPLPDCEHISENQIYLGFSGPFNSFFALLNALERHRPVVFVNKFAITRSNQERSGNDISMELAVFVTKRKVSSKDSS